MCLLYLRNITEHVPDLLGLLFATNDKDEETHALQLASSVRGWGTPSSSGCGSLFGKRWIPMRPAGNLDRSLQIAPAIAKFLILVLQRPS